MGAKEFHWIESLRKMIPPASPGDLGIGDDAAVLSWPRGRNLVVTTDAMVEGVDFIRGELAPEWAGRKALAVNLSDLAAMGARPHAFVVALGLPKDLSFSWVKRFYRGMIGLARKHKTVCVGGDMSRSREFFAALTLWGYPCGRSVTRCGAKPGDKVVVTGNLGGSILGRHYRFEPRLAESSFLVRHFQPSSMIDISDGFAQDLGHILKASGVGAKIFLSKIPVSSSARRLGGRDPSLQLEHALSDGEDFELIFTVRPRVLKNLSKVWRRKFAKTRLTEVGVIEAGPSVISWDLGGSGLSHFRLKKTGYTHF